MIKTFLTEVGDLVPRTIWKYEDVGSSRTAKLESKALFGSDTSFSTPKPERLIERILRIASNEGDVVLDCFAGSGTTPAVAHKLRRRWIAIERQARTITDYALPRLNAAVSGSDTGGITRDVDWHGGGGLRHMRVAPSMFEQDQGLVFLADWMTNGALAEATAAQLGFTYEIDPPFAGRKGRTRLAVLNGLVNESVVRLLVGGLPDSERLVVCGTAIDTEARSVLRDLRPGSTMRKIPSALLSQYRDDLKAARRPVENEEPGQ
jgi:adenine-specific DNA-methyltransferase